MVLISTPMRRHHLLRPPWLVFQWTRQANTTRIPSQLHFKLHSLGPLASMTAAMTSQIVRYSFTLWRDNKTSVKLQTLTLFTIFFSITWRGCYIIKIVSIINLDESDIIPNKTIDINNCKNKSSEKYYYKRRPHYSYTFTKLKCYNVARYFSQVAWHAGAHALPLVELQILLIKDQMVSIQWIYIKWMVTVFGGVDF